MKRTQAVETHPEPRLGVFLCECGNRIAPLVDLASLARRLFEAPLVEHVEVLPFSCLTPGLDRIKEMTRQKGLNRLIVAGCEARIVHKKFEQHLEPLGVEEGQIELVNLRDHVAQVNAGSPADLAGTKKADRSGSGVFHGRLTSLRPVGP